MNDFLSEMSEEGGEWGNIYDQHVTFHLNILLISVIH